jgi:alginate O-acetyltransferase complex protein AlgI
LAKKVLIANVIGAHADAIFAMEYSEIGSINLWIGALAYTFQIYFDFAGYSDMAIGLGKMMGFKFPENFDSPYASLNISEFWRRWHITLGNFMKDYLYIPLGGNRTSSKFRLYFNLFIVFLLSGFWHGASWNFILWGMFHGLFLILDRLFLVKLLTKLGRFIATLFTFIVVLFGWVLFKIEAIGELLIYIENMFNFSSSEEILLDKSIIVSMIVASIFSFLVSFKFGKKISSWFYDMESVSLKKHLVSIGISLFLGFWSISSIVASDFNPFIYFRF